MKSLSVTVEVLFGIVFVVCSKWFLSSLAEILSCSSIRPLKLLKNFFSFLQGLCKILVIEMFIFEFDMESSRKTSFVLVSYTEQGVFHFSVFGRNPFVQPFK